MCHSLVLDHPQLLSQETSLPDTSLLWAHIYLHFIYIERTGNELFRNEHRAADWFKFHVTRQRMNFADETHQELCGLLFIPQTPDFLQLGIE